MPVSLMALSIPMEVASLVTESSSMEAVSAYRVTEIVLGRVGDWRGDNIMSALSLSDSESVIKNLLGHGKQMLLQLKKVGTDTRRQRRQHPPIVNYSPRQNLFRRGQKAQKSSAKHHTTYSFFIIQTCFQRIS